MVSMEILVGCIGLVSHRLKQNGCVKLHNNARNATNSKYKIH